jgi:hypothetical protein
MTDLKPTRCMALAGITAGLAAATLTDVEVT